MKLFPSSIKWQAALITSSVFAATLLIFGWVSLGNIRESHRIAADYQMALTQRIAGDLDSRMEGMTAALQAVGNVAPETVFQDAETAEKWLDDRTGIKSTFFNQGLFLTDRQGRLLAASSPQPQLAAAPEFGTWAKITLKLEEPIISQPFWVDAPNPDSRRSLALMVAVPVLDSNGRVLGVFAGALDLNGETMLGSISQMRVGKTGYFFITSWDGSLVMHPDSNRLLHKNVHPVPPTLLARAAHGFRGAEETVASDGVPVLSSLVKLQSTGWVIGANQPTSEAYALFHKQQRLAVLFIVLGLFVAAGVNWLVMRLFLLPLEKLSNDINHLDAGSQQIKFITLSGGGTEITRLASAFNGLLERLNENREQLASEKANLKELNETLEQRVRKEVANNRDKDHLLIQQSRLAAMGEMVHNIAHQWRQPLNALAILLANIKDAHAFNELDEETLNGSVATGQRLIQKMSGTIDDFRNFFRPNSEAKRFQVQGTVDEVLTLTQASFQSNQITLRCENEVPFEAMGYPNELSQVILNLITNAKDAIQARKITDGEVTISIVQQNDTIRISVSDNGGGIPSDILPKIFDPYFTTKETGTGIGLYMSKMIMEKMNGEITVCNTAHGAEFVLSLPVAPRPTDNFPEVG